MWGSLCRGVSVSGGSLSRSLAVDRMTDASENITVEY